MGSFAICVSIVSAKLGIKEAEILKDSFCYQIVGTWEQPEWGGDTVNFYDTGIAHFKSAAVSYENE